MLTTGAPPSYTEYVAIVAWSGRRCREENLKIREVSPRPAVPPPRGSRATELTSYFLFLMSFNITGWFA